MRTAPETTIEQSDSVLTAGPAPNPASALDVLDNPRALREACFHCGTECPDHSFAIGGRKFCCQGCRTVFDLLNESGLSDFYRLEPQAGVRVAPNLEGHSYDYLDEQAVSGRLADFSDDHITRVTLRVPSIHCIACVWLLENLHRLNSGIVRSDANFPRKEVAVTFERSKTKMSEVAALLASLGYPPEFKLADVDARPRNTVPKGLWLQLGMAGFAFGNTMMFSIAAYLGLDSLTGPAFRRLTGWISLLLAIPVFLFSASGYWRSAWSSLRRRMLTIDVPIAAGIAALFGQSVYEFLSGRGEGYFDSLAGLLFFLLCGKLFQQRTYDRLSFDRDYKSFFPLAITRRNQVRSQQPQAGPSQIQDGKSQLSIGVEEERVSLDELRAGDHLLIRNGELIPADATLIAGPALIDYSFVTGESAPVEKREGDYLYAGGRQIGGRIEIETAKAVSQSYLASLWGQEAFRKQKSESFDSLTNRYSYRFTWGILAIAVGAALFWSFVEPSTAVKAFSSVLIVACPCALALAAPFALGTAQRILAREKVFLKDAEITEVLARVTSIVFDKTGTLTAPAASAVQFRGEPLSRAEQGCLFAVAQHSTHPIAVQICSWLAPDGHFESAGSFREIPGCGIEGRAGEHEIWLGSLAWFASKNLEIPETARPVACAGATHLAIDRKYRGTFPVASPLRYGIDGLVHHLSKNFDLAMLSGDNERERERFHNLFGPRTCLLFDQSPHDKLHFVRALQDKGHTVMMVGDGLNDAGALQQSNAGVAVLEDINAFSPASDVILSAAVLPKLGEILRFSKAVVRIVRMSFVVSAFYNVAGIAIAATGNLSPVICAVLMPLSSATVVAVACGATFWAGRRAGFKERVS